MAGRNKLKWEETKPGRWEAGEFAIVHLDSIEKFSYVLYQRGKIKNFCKDKADAKKQVEKLNKNDD